MTAHPMYITNVYILQPHLLTDRMEMNYTSYIRKGGYLRVCVHHMVDLVSEAITFGLQRAAFSVTDYSIQNKVSK